MARRVTLALAFVLAARMAEAQVGYPPRESPFRDLREAQDVTFYTGYFRAKKDPARVAPQSGPMMGMRYNWRAAGPANITFDVGRVSSERLVLDPERSETCASADRACKYLGTWRWPLYTVDAGLALALTGARSFHGFVPEVRTGLGLATDFHSRADVGEFAFGTRFAISWGAGVRWLTGNRFQLRAELLNRLYSIKYPRTYYLPADDGTSVFTIDQNETAWLNNPAFTIGVSYLFSR